MATGIPDTPPSQSIVRDMPAPAPKMNYPRKGGSPIIGLILAGQQIGPGGEK